ncbi:hypothetical protein TRICHSKD4_0905 [Roseibium sp. TrichSKD4]|uniref:hypothetical protein n=1 Tax=Roseibium sp. TrichSKD4 TaxID=744980 RepID=UPI0001E56238|nr:hypothetical protein [Roseibium sp. TrichSKD4]EFO33791.1 hypothetical protein TRICHSKD4_0905 [Roseibium sp. TrichSKD4]
MNTNRAVEIVVAADEPALFYDSIASAELHLESTDVQDGVYGPVFGIKGEVYSIRTAGDRVAIIADPLGRTDVIGLKEVLSTFLRTIKPDMVIPDCLDTMLQLCTPYLESVSVMQKTQS